MSKAAAAKAIGGLTATSKMGCKSYSLPTSACVTGARMAQVKGSVCSICYADRGFYKLYAKTIVPAQNARLASIESPDWVINMVTAIGKDKYFRWHDSGDIQSLAHLEKIAQVCELTPGTRHWLPTREYAIAAMFTATHAVPANLIIRLSAMFPDVPVKVPAKLAGIPGVAVSNVHADKAASGMECPAPRQGNKCLDCRACWNRDVESVSYHQH